MGFFAAKERHVLVPNSYCKVFILPNPNDPTHIWGFYTLSPSLLVRGRSSTQEQKRNLPLLTPLGAFSEIRRFLLGD
jgi:hypothetical protein